MMIMVILTVWFDWRSTLWSSPISPHTWTSMRFYWVLYEIKPEQEGSTNLLVKKVAQRDVRNKLYWRNEIWRVQGKPQNIGDLILKGFSWGSLKDHCIYGYPSLWWLLHFPYDNFVSHILYVGHDCHLIKVFKYNFSYQI